MKKIIAALTAAISVNSASAQEATSKNSILLGPDGQNAISFGNYRAQSQIDTFGNPNRVGAYVGFSRTITAPGSGVFGPANADVSTLFSARKQNFLTSKIEGEVLTQYLLNEQGRKGDAASLLASTSKVKTGSQEDTGGALGYEFRAAFVDPSGTVVNSVHSYGPYMAPTNDMSGGTGYGSYVESFNGTNFSAFTAGAYLSSDPLTGWRNVVVATTDRMSRNIYFRVRGSKALEGAEKPGDVVIGSVAPKTIRNNGGAFQIRNAADSATLLEISEAGALGLPADPSWETYSPNIFCGQGVIERAKSSGAYKALGKTVHVRIEASIEDLGSCSTRISISLPAPARASQVFAGTSIMSKKMLQGLTEPSSAQLQVLDYSGQFPLQKKDSIILNGTFESM
jgi:hypothetical protein